MLATQQAMRTALHDSRLSSAVYLHTLKKASAQVVRLQGFHPEDFQRSARRDPGCRDVHPDIMPPGPGRFDDSMFG